MYMLYINNSFECRSKINLIAQCASKIFPSTVHFESNVHFSSGNPISFLSHLNYQAPEHDIIDFFLFVLPVPLRLGHMLYVQVRWTLAGQCYPSTFDKTLFEWICHEWWFRSMTRNLLASSERDIINSIPYIINYYFYSEETTYHKVLAEYVFVGRIAPLELECCIIHML